MKVSRSTGYGLIAVGYVAKHSLDKPVLSSDISKEYKIPLEYLLKILQQLVRANILRSKRGPRGGFTMARSLEEITMLDVIEAVEGSLDARMNLSELTNSAPFSLKMENTCQKATDEVRSIYRKAKLNKILAD